MKINLGDILIMKKPHVCGSHRWLVTRNGAEVKMKCEKCGREVMIFKAELLKRVKSVESKENNE